MPAPPGDGRETVIAEAFSVIDRAIDAAWQDIHDWVRLALEQRAACPNPNHAPNMPSEAGISKSRAVREALAAASVRLEAIQRDYALAKQHNESWARDYAGLAAKLDAAERALLSAPAAGGARWEDHAPEWSDWPREEKAAFLRGLADVLEGKVVPLPDPSKPSLSTGARVMPETNNPAPEEA